MSPGYRREIDGLRAVAVSAVVLYHAGFGPAAGFVGVDVFFVISGYLITALLARELGETGRIDVLDFYARRARRILPASILVIAIVIAALPQLPQVARQGISESALAASLFVANFHFQAQASGYFTGDAGQFPLLHLWSLSVEEQFYLVWPALLIALARGGLPMRGALCVLALASFVLTECLLLSDPSAAFYLMPARAWELAAGGIVALMPRSQRMPGWSVWAGLLVVALAAIVPLGHFPGMGALPAVLGSALILAALHGGAGNALLASKPMVGIGLISYSLYLWHWPLLAVDRLMRVGPSPPEVRLALVCASLLLAIGSYRYVEAPLRRLRTRRLATVLSGAAAMLLLAGFAFLARGPAARPSVPLASERICHPYVEGQLPMLQPPECLPGAKKVVIWGDSYAYAWAPLAQDVAAKLKLPVVLLAHYSCPPLPGVRLPLANPVTAENCQRWNSDALAYLQNGGADTVILAGRWQSFIQAGGSNAPAKALAQAVSGIAPHVRRILIIGPTPELTDEPRKCMELGLDCSIERKTYEAGAAESWKAIRALVQPNVSVSDPGQWLCDKDRCPGVRDGNALYTDTSHVSGYSAQAWARIVVEGMAE